MKTKNIPVLILAGGKGTRLKSVVSDRPKPMADINGIPFLDLLIKQYKNHKIYISVGYKKEYIMDYYKDTVEYIIEDEPLGTGGAIKKACDIIKSKYLIIINGDTFSDIKLPKKFKGNILLNSLYLHNASRYNTISKNNNTVKFLPKGKLTGFINSGIYIINSSIFKNEEELFSFETFLEQNSELIEVQEHNKYFIDIGVPEDYKKAQEDFKDNTLKEKTFSDKQILFLDRDGVINKDREGYFYDYDKIEYNYDVLDMIKKQYPNHIKIIVTNQSGISRGYFTHGEFHYLMFNIKEDLLDYGIRIDDVMYCHSLPEENSPNRKPNPGMILEGLIKYNADPKNCTMIGDKESDREAALRAGLGGFILYKGNE